MERGLDNLEGLEAKGVSYRYIACVCDIQYVVGVFKTMLGSEFVVLDIDGKGVHLRR
jgi:hypothetical protein